MGGDDLPFLLEVGIAQNLLEQKAVQLGFRQGIDPLLLDGVLIDRYPQRFEEYWKELESVDPLLVEAAVNRMARIPTDRLAWLIDLYRREQFLRSYVNDESLLHRLNQVLRRVKLSSVPAEAEEVVRAGRLLVNRRINDLLPPEYFSFP